MFRGQKEKMPAFSLRHRKKIKKNFPHTSFFEKKQEFTELKKFIRADTLTRCFFIFFKKTSTSFGGQKIHKNFWKKSPFSLLQQTTPTSKKFFKKCPQPFFSDKKMKKRQEKISIFLKKSKNSRFARQLKKIKKTLNLIRWPKIHKNLKNSPSCQAIKKSKKHSTSFSDQKFKKF